MHSESDNEMGSSRLLISCTSSCEGGIEARPKRIFGERLFPNLLLLARQQERVALRIPNYGLINIKGS